MHRQFQAKSIHSLLAVGNCSSAAELESRVQADLRSTGFGEIRVFECVRVPTWRAFLPNKQGKLLRAGIRGVSITLYSENDRNWSAADA